MGICSFSGDDEDSVASSPEEGQAENRFVSVPPQAQGLNRASPFSRDEAEVLRPLLHRTQESRWPSANPRFVSLESDPSHAPVQDADAEAHYQMHPTPGLVCSDRPEGRLLSCLDSPSPVPTIYIRGSGMAVQGPPLRAFPVPPCLYESRGGRTCPDTGSGHQDPQLSRRLAHYGPVTRGVVRSHAPGPLAPQPVGASGQLGKEQTLPCAEDLFS